MFHINIDNLEDDSETNQSGTTGNIQATDNMFGIKTPVMQLDEARKLHAVASQTLNLFQANIGETMERRNPTELQRTKRRIEEKLKNIQELNTQMSYYMVQAGISCEEVARFNYESDLKLDIYEDMVMQLEEVLESIKGEKLEQSSTSEPTVSQPARVPKLELSTYGGDPLKWLEFWEQFSSVIHSSSLATTMKFHYLRKVLVGRAAAVIKGLPTTEDNYLTAVRRLQKEFGDDTKLRSAHVKAIRDIQPVTSSQNLFKLRRFYEEISANYASLESMQYEEQVVCLVEETVMKLPRNIRYEITKDDRHWTRWKFPQFLNNLWSYLRACEEIDIPEAVRSRSEPPKRSVLHATTNRTVECVYCKDNNHKSFECNKVIEVAARKAILQEQKRCYNCTRTNHSLRECMSKNVCYHCRSKHHSSICPTLATTTEASNNITDEIKHIRNGPVAYQTVKAEVGNEVCRILLDSGSGKSYISREHGRKLKLKPCRKESRVIGTVNGEMEVHCPIYKLEVNGIGQAKGKFTTEFAELDLFMLSSVPNIHPDLQRMKYPHLKGIWFSDVSSDKDLQIHAILGVKDYAHIKTGRIIKGDRNEPIAEETTLGWTLMGGVQDDDQRTSNRSITNVMVEKPSSIAEDFKKLYDVDILGIKDGSEDVYEEFQDNITKLNDGRYSVKLPWKKGQYYLPSNKQLCEIRLKNLIKKLKNDQETFNAYDEVMKNQIRDGIVEFIPEQPDGKRISYLPHNCVIRKEAETTKLRIVYDASAKQHKYNKSLNDCLHTGPPLQPMLYDILLRFRMYPVAIIGDIEKAFLQIEVDKADRDAMRFLWLKDIRQEPPEIQELRFTRVIFGSGPSPFLLGATIREHLESYRVADPEFVALVLRSLFVDDFVSGGKNTEEVKQLKSKLIERFNEGHFNMRKWKSSDATLRETENKNKKVEAVTINDQTKVLGIAWNQEADEMAIDFEKICNLDYEPTQRGILRLAAAIYDPLGIASPVSIIAKILYHDVCMQKQGWDKTINADLLKSWKKWLNELAEQKTLSFSRLLLPYHQEEVIRMELHGFADSSIKACCAVIYLLVQQKSGVQAKLLTAKSRVAKPNLSVPRLELIGAQMLTKLIQNVKSALTEDLNGIYGWLDSQTVLCWLQNKGEYKQFVRNRIDQILEEEDINWNYCPTNDNPADLGTRGTTLKKLQECEVWWNGPDWLIQREKWPQQPEHLENEAAQEERRNTTILTTTTTAEPVGITNCIDVSRCNSALKMIRITAWVLRFINKARKNATETSKILKISEIEAAEIAWVKESQTLYPPSPEQVNQLGLRADKFGIFRCHGRFNLQEDQQPIYIPRQHQLVKYLVIDAHKRTMHMGVESTLAELRSRFWIPKGRQCVKKAIKDCRHCKRFTVRPFNDPTTAPIPEHRKTPGYAFQTTGVDFAGPFYYKDNKRLKKAYITLFTCATTRAIHLELVTDMTATTFRKSLKSLVARRGTPSVIISDNAKTFKATAKWLRSIHKDKKTEEFSQDQKIDWRFNLSRASWWGGFFERMVGMVKSTLKKSLSQAHLKFAELQEILLDVEFSLNNRPLTYQGNDLDKEALTPNHLIHGRRMKTIQEATVYSDEEDKSDAIKRLKYLQTCKTKYWRRWAKEYLASLREHHKIVTGKKNNISEGDIVLIKDENSPRNMWKIGKVIEIIKGADDVIRGATLKTVTKGNIYEIDRPVQHLYPLELKVEQEAKSSHQEKIDSDDEVKSNVRPKRAASQDAKGRITATTILEEDED
eukprot:gene6668-biopygen5443